MLFFGAVYALYYALPVLSVERYARLFYSTADYTFHADSGLLPDEILEHALLLALAGLCVLFLAYYWIARPLERLLPRLNMKWTNVRKLRLTCMLFGILGLGAYYIRLVAPISLQMTQFVLLLSDVCFVAVTALFMLQLKRKLPPSWVLFLWGGLIIPRVLLGFGTGGVAHGVDIVLLLLVTLTTIRQKVPVAALLLGTVLLFISLPVKQEVRNRTWIGSDAKKSPVEKSGIYLDVLADFLSGKGIPFSDGMQIGIQRIGQILTLADVVALTPSVVPYWMGETYYPLLWKPIPRFLYPDKPMEQSGQDFGHRYKFLSTTDGDTSYNLPQLVEFYANFGSIGVIIGMFLLGLIYRSIDYMCFHNDSGMGALVAGLYILSKLLLIESALSLVLGGVVWGAVLLTLFHLVVKATSAHSGGAAL